jgi:site-specific recombinase XerD
MRASSLEKEKAVAEELTKEFGVRPIGMITTDDIAAYREKWKLAGVTAQRKLGRIRSFFHFCVSRDWIRKNPAMNVRMPKVHEHPTLPLTKEEFEKVLWASEVFPVTGIYGVKNRTRIKAFMLLLRYSGLRIRDAVSFSFDKLEGNKLLLYSHKTRVPVRVPLPEFVVKVHNAHDGISNYVFWSGNGHIKSCVGDWWRTMQKLSALSGVKLHAHRLRNTFAVELLKSGATLETVATLLGNTIKVAEKHYAPWVLSRQVALEASVEKAWKLA